MGTALSEMYQYMMPELPGCPKPLIIQHLRETIREWAYRTQAWEQDLNDIDIVDGTSDYELDSPVEDTEIAGLVHRPSDDVGVHYDGRLLSPGVEYTIPVAKDVIHLVSAPVADLTDGLEITAVLTLANDATASSEVPDRLFQDYRQTWAYGAMSRLMLMKGKKWSDKETGILYHNIYWDAIRLAIGERTRGRTNRSLRVQHPAAFA